MEEESVKFYLAKEMSLYLNLEGLSGEKDGVIEGQQEVSISILWENVKSAIAVLEESPNSSSLQQKFCEILRSTFENKVLRCSVKMHCRKHCDDKRRALGTAKTELCFKITGDPVLDDLGSRLNEIFEGGATFFEVEMNGWKSEYGSSWDPKGLDFKTKEMKVIWPTGERPLFCRDDTYNPAIDRLMSGACNALRYNAKVNLFLIAKDYGPSERERKAVFNRMLEGELAPDTVINPGNGAEVKCHRIFLVAHSDVFESMFGTDMQEAKTRRIEMPYMSEEGVRAFLAYLYHWDLSKAEESCSVALEVLMAAHKYNIRLLEKAMRKLLLSKPESWYEVDMAMKLFLFVHKLEERFESLKRKAVMVLQKYSGDLRSSATFQELFHRDPEAAMDFYQYSMSVMPSPSEF